MRKALLVIVLVVVVGTVSGATVFRENIARAAAGAAPPQPVTVTNAVAQAVPVREVSPAQQPQPAYFRGTEGFNNPVVPAVPAGKRFIVTYVNLVAVNPAALTCTLAVGTQSGGFSGFAAVILQNVDAVVVASEEVFIPMEAGQALAVDDCAPNGATVRIGGYFTPAS